MPTRRCKEGFLLDYLSYATDGTEVPKYFAMWCGVLIIAASLERKCYVLTRPIVYPNLYVVLVAQSAHCRKSTAIGQAMDVMRSMANPPTIFAQKTTPEALISSMAKDQGPEITDKENDVSTHLPAKAQGLLVASELSTLLTRDSHRNGLIDLLTHLWDSSRDAFVYSTKARGEESICEPCLSLLGATTVAWLKTSIPPESIGGGFTSRIIFINAPESDNDCPWPEVSQRMLQLQENLSHDLDCIKLLNGEFKPTPAGKRLFSDLYSDFKHHSKLRSNPNLAGYAGRRGTILHKIAMVMSVANGDSMTLDVEDYKIANELLEETEKTMENVLDAVLMTADGQTVDEVYQFIAHGKEVTRTELTRRFSGRKSARELDDIIHTLCSAGLVKDETRRNAVIYTPVEHQAPAISLNELAPRKQGEKK